MKHISRSERGARIGRSELSEGQTVIVEWSPYGWARDNEGYKGRHTAEITSIQDFSGDIKFEDSEGNVFTDLGEGRAQVMGNAANTSDVPDYTDVGRGARYYAEGDA